MMANRGSRLTEADREAWTGFTRHIAPLPGRAAQAGRPDLPSDLPSKAEAASPGAASALPIPRRVRTPAKPGAAASALEIGGPPGGVDKATWQRFRTGKLAAVRRLDLHGMTAQRAFQALTGFLRAAHAEQVRCVEIVTGRGSREGNIGSEGTGVIRREFPSWLNRPDIRPLVLAAAHPHAANPGSVRLLLRRLR